MKLKPLVLIAFSIVLMVTAYYVSEWVDDFVDPACDGMHGNCPPSFWECTFMGTVSTIMMLMAVVIASFGVLEYSEKW